MAGRQAPAAATLALLLLASATTLSAASPSAAAALPTTSRKLLHYWDPVLPVGRHQVRGLRRRAGRRGRAGRAQLGSKCCDFVQGLAAAEAAACFCTTIKEAVLGIPTEWTVHVGVLASACKTELPHGFQCV
ncbi:hypothetical protein BS78_06G249000 [Paspalum vaginatum]|nr:hypothetical protein BS78_06G249000 [Paspalum vaginatum]